MENIVYRGSGGNRVYSIQYTTTNCNNSGGGIESENKKDDQVVDTFDIIQKNTKYQCSPEIIMLRQFNQ